MLRFSTGGESHGEALVAILSGMPAGVRVDPKFVDAGHTNYHLSATSPVKDLADPAASITTDFDGDPRPQNGRSDMGADEVTP